MFILHQPKNIYQLFIGEDRSLMHLGCASSIFNIFLFRISDQEGKTLCDWYAIVRAAEEITKKNNEKLFDRVNSQCHLSSIDIIAKILCTQSQIPFNQLKQQNGYFYFYIFFFIFYFVRSFSHLYNLSVGSSMLLSPFTFARSLNTFSSLFTNQSRIKR